MYKEETENIEIYFICSKKDMDLVESYYDAELNIHSWYFNAYLAYQHWQNNFKDLKLGKMAKMLLTVATSRYIIYSLEEKNYQNPEEQTKLIHDLKKIEPKLQKIIKNNSFLANLK